MSKKDKKKDAKKKGNGVELVDNTPEGVAKTALEALSDEQRAAVLEELGIPVRKAREKKDTGPSPKELFLNAQEKLFNQMPGIKTIVDDCEFPSSFAVTVGVDPEGLFFANLKRVRNKYGPRKDDS